MASSREPVYAELTRTAWHRGEAPHIHFWRTSTGAEVDFLVEEGADLIPIEVKLSATPRPRMARTSRSCGKRRQFPTRKRVMPQR